jgi:hypothetical protein
MPLSPLIVDEEQVYEVIFTPYSHSHYEKDLSKKYKGNQWADTRHHIEFELSKVQKYVQYSNRVNTIVHNNVNQIFKYEFSIMTGGKIHARKGAHHDGCRALCYLDNINRRIEVLYIYHKTFLPKNKPEHTHGDEILQSQYGELLQSLKIL